MNSLKVVQAISALSQVDRNRFKKFVESPYFNGNSKLVYLLEEIEFAINKNIDAKNHLNNAMLSSLSDLTNNQLRKQLSDLLRLFEDFISIEEMKYLNKKNVYLLRGIENRQLGLLKNSVRKRVKNMFIKENIRSSYYHLDRYEVENILYEIDKVDIKRVSKKNDITERLTSAFSELNLFYYMEQLRLLVSAHGWSHIVSSDIIKINYFSIINQIKALGIESDPIIKTYTSIYESQLHPDDNSKYFELKSNIDKNINLFHPQEAKNIIKSAMNFCSRKINSGEREFTYEALSLYKKLIKDDLLLNNNRLSPWTFKNIVSVAVRCGDLKWVKNFIESYNMYLEGDYSQSIINLCKAQLDFYQGNWNQVISRLQNVEFKEFSLKVNAEIYIIAVYYELDEFEILSSTLQNFKKYLLRQKSINKKQLEYPKNFIKFISRITKPKSKDKVRLLRTKIYNTQNIASKTWLLEKVDELLGENKESPSLEKGDS